MSNATWQRGQYLVQMADDDRLLIVTGWIHPHGTLGISRTPRGHLDRWVVTHLPTGCVCGGAVPSLGAAFHYARLLAVAPIDWRSVTDSVADKDRATDVGFPIWEHYRAIWRNPTVRRSFHYPWESRRPVPRRPKRLATVVATAARVQATAEAAL